MGKGYMHIGIPDQSIASAAAAGAVLCLHKGEGVQQLQSGGLAEGRKQPGLKTPGGKDYNVEACTKPRQTCTK